jgi:hypothetical protein
MERKVSKLTVLRLCLSGAVFGAAAIGIVSGFFGLDNSLVRDLFGATAGGAVAAFAIKALHVI